MSKTHTHTHIPKQTLQNTVSVCRKRSCFLWKICSVQAATFFYLYTFTWKYKWLGFSNKHDYNLSIFLLKFCQSPNQTFLTDCIHVSCLPLLTVTCDWFVCNSGVHCWNGYFFKYRVCASLLCVKGDVYVPLMYACVFLYPQREEHVRSLQPTDAATRTALRSVPRLSSARVYREKWLEQHGTNPPV